jgi:hypothetical protein
MKAIFYDRRNKREVSCDQLMASNLVEEYVTADTDGEAPCRLKNKHDLYVTEKTIAELAYKSEKCPSYCNHDLDTTLSELVFLRLEDE